MFGKSCGKGAKNLDDTISKRLFQRPNRQIIGVV